MSSLTRRTQSPPHKRHSAKSLVKQHCDYNPNMTVDVWTDAAYTRRQQKPSPSGQREEVQPGERRIKYAGLGIYWGTNHPNNLSYPITEHDQWLEKGPLTSNTAEFMAAQMAMMQAAAQGIRRLRVLTDSMVVVSTLSKTIRKEIKKSFKQYTLKACPFTRRARYWIRKFHYIRFEKVRAHAGIAPNEEADRLAKNALDPARAKYRRELEYYAKYTPRKERIARTNAALTSPPTRARATKRRQINDTIEYRKRLQRESAHSAPIATTRMDDNEASSSRVRTCSTSTVSIRSNSDQGSDESVIVLTCIDVNAPYSRAGQSRPSAKKRRRSKKRLWRNANTTPRDL